RNPGRSLAVVLLLALTAVGLGLAGMQLWAAYHFRAARRALDHYHAAEAGDHLAACLRVWPDDPDVLFLAARAARCSGLFESAADFLNRTQELRGRDDELVLERALLTAERGDVDEVLKFSRAKVEADDPAAPLILEAVARGCLRAYPYRLRDADWAVKAWLKRDPDNPMALLLRGRLDHERFADTAAAAAFRRALEIDPELDEARDRLSGLLLDTNQPAEALPHLEYLRRRRPGEAALAVRHAQCLHLLGRASEAEAVLDGVLAARPNFGPALAERGKLALEAGQDAEAEGWLRRAVERTPTDASLLPALQKCLSRLGKDDEARELEPRVRQAREDLERLDKLISEDVQNHPDDANAQYEAGTVLLRLGDYEDGVRRLEHATRLDPRHVKAHEALADFYRRAGEPLKAAEHQRLAREAGEK
ncbi:MAG TPA: tetratricopeptide repeat protein, partial [Gemmataceae bacterium]|nr:tetratricopeptide repeat protein [Gemmataceae bacterium]